MNKEQTLKVIEVLDKLTGAVEEIHMHLNYINDDINNKQTQLLSDCSDIISQLRTFVSANDIETGK